MTLDQRLIAIGTLVAVVCAALVGTRLAREPAHPPVAAVVRNVDVGADGKLSLLWAGDTMLGGAAQPLLAQHGYGWPFERLRPLLNADFTIANSDAPITALIEPWDRSKKDSYQMAPPAAAALAGAGIDAISLANDHVMDRGPNGLSDTLVNAGRAGISAIGAGDDIARAQQPLILKSAVGTIGVVAFTEYSDRDAQAARTRPGAMVLDREALERGIGTARAAGAEWVVAYVHWGDVYNTVNARQRYWAQQLSRAGYAMVVGTGPHVAQPVEVINGMPVVYSLGNFAFGSPGRFARSGWPGIGLLLTTEHLRGRGATVALRCISTDNLVVGFQPQPCTPQQELAVLPTLRRPVAIRGHVAVVATNVMPKPPSPASAKVG
jgi:poly-gamma-glutamate synthesis protein (capsule biosynthesis protein)